MAYKIWISNKIQIQAFEKTADVAKARAYSNWAVHPCSSGNDDLPGVGKIEIDFCHQIDRQAQHLHRVGGCKQTPARRSWLPFRTQAQVMAEETRPAVIRELEVAQPKLLTFQYRHERERCDWKASQTGKRLAAKYKSLRHLSNTKRRGRFLRRTWGRLIALPTPVWQK